MNPVLLALLLLQKPAQRLFRSSSLSLRPRARKWVSVLLLLFRILPSSYIIKQITVVEFLCQYREDWNKIKILYAPFFFSIIWFFFVRKYILGCPLYPKLNEIQHSNFFIKSSCQKSEKKLFWNPKGPKFTCHRWKIRFWASSNSNFIFILLRDQMKI